MKNPILMFLLGVCAGGVGVWFLKPMPAVQTELEQLTTIRRPKVTQVKAESSLNDPTKPPAPKPIDPKVLELKEKLLPLLVFPTEEQRSVAVRAECTKITPENAFLYQNAWKEVTAANPNGGSHWGLINRRLGQVVGAEVVGSRTGVPRDMAGAKTYVKDQLLGWLETDPKAAQIWFQNLKVEAFQSALLEAYMKDLESGNISEALVP